MEYILEKFIEYLDKRIQKHVDYAPELINAEFKKTLSIRKAISINFKLYHEYGIEDIYFLLSYLTDSRETLIEKHHIFADYDILSKYLTEFPSYDKERMILLIESIKNNIESIQKSEKSKKNITFYNEQVTSNLIEKAMYKVIMRRRIKFRKKYENDNIDKMISYIKIIQERYLEKINSFDEEDIKIITETLKNMKVNNQMCDEINKLLMKEYRSRISEKETSIPYVSTKQTKKESKDDTESKVLSKKEYYEKTAEVGRYFDLKQMQATRYISISEKVNLIRLLQELNYENTDIERMLKIVDNGNKIYHEETHPMMKYIDTIDKIMYYKEQLELTEQQIEDLKYNFGLLFMCDSNEYVQWKDELLATLQSLENRFPKTHKYEIAQAEKASILVKR